MTHKWICPRCSKVISKSLKKIKTHKCGCGASAWIEYKPIGGENHSKKG